MKVLIALLCLAIHCVAVDHRAVVWGGVNVGLAALDYETALRVQGATRPCYESNPFWGTKYPSRARFYGRGLPLDIGIEVFGYFVGRKLHHHLQWLPFAALSGSHLYGTVTNLTCGR